MKFNFQTELHFNTRSMAALQNTTLHTLYQNTKIQLLSYIGMLFLFISAFYPLIILP